MFEKSRNIFSGNGKKLQRAGFGGKFYRKKPGGKKGIGYKRDFKRPGRKNHQFGKFRGKVLEKVSLKFVGFPRGVN